MLIGNAGRDAELRYTANGIPQASFSLAVNNRRRGQSGEWEDNTEWFNVILFRDQAERLSQYITKGKSLYVEGRLQTRTWDDDQGQKHYRTEVIANTIQLLGGREGGQGSDGGNWDDGGSRRPGAAPRSGGYSGPRGENSGDIDVDDLPFE
jgi:single-strand DNA-binding protein